MDAFIRQTKILDSVRETGYVTLAGMTAELGVSPVTIHRDFAFLQKQGSIERVRGGAHLPEHGSHEIRKDFMQRLGQNPDAKREIAETARRFVSDGDTVFFDSSTTALALLHPFEISPPSALTIVTNSPAIANSIHTSTINVVMVPGELDQSLRSVAGRWATEFLERLSFSSVFISAAGIMPDGLRTTHRSLADIASAVLPCTAKTFALVDHTKFDVTGMIPIAGPADVTVITDSGICEDTAQRYRHHGWEIETS